MPGTVSGSTEEPSLLLPIFISSVALHLLLVGLLGARVPQLETRQVKHIPPPPAEVRLIEEVKLEPDPEQPKDLPTPPDESAAAIDLPAVSRVEPISAVPISIPVAFGIQVKGPVRLVDDPAQASGAVGGRPGPIAPVALDDDAAQEKNLLLPTLSYPTEALKWRQTGIVQVEFRTSATGDISEVKVRESSGFPVLDHAAVNNLREGRWVGAAGYYRKRFVFRLN